MELYRKYKRLEEVRNPPVL